MLLVYLVQYITVSLYCEGVHGGLVGFALLQSISCIEGLSWFMTVTADLESQVQHLSSKIINSTILIGKGCFKFLFSLIGGAINMYLKLETARKLYTDDLLILL